LLEADARACALLEEGAAADPEPGHGDYRPDRYTAAVALRYLEERAPRFLFLGLGDTDEHAHAGDYAAYVRALRASDGVLDELYRVLARMGERGRATSVFVTADHGRGHDYRHHGRAFPESRRVWLVAAGPAIAEKVGMGERVHTLSDI